MTRGKNCEPIPGEILAEMLEWRQLETLSFEKIKDRAYEKYKLKTSVAMISKSLTDLTSKTNDVYYQTIKEEARKLSTDCLTIIDENIKELNRCALILANSRTISHKLAGAKIAETTLKFIVQKFQLTGIDNKEQKIEKKDEELFASLLKKLGE